MKIELNQKKVYFASDFHLGTPDAISSRNREDKIIRWLKSVQDDAAAIFLVGDLFDFWFEYDTVIPKGYIRFLGKLAELRDRNIPVFIFTGNHDLWMRDYFSSELGIPVHHNPLEVQLGDIRLLVGHGDGLGPGDQKYKLLKKIFTNGFCQWLFKWIHPDLGIRLAYTWSKNSRITNLQKNEQEFKGDNEWLWQYCKQVQESRHFDYYIFGHRHLPLHLPVGKKSSYINLGEWVTQCNYGVYDGEKFELKHFDQ
jgi:UDP-2,3-diacylglucosamine hydrolase